MLVQRTNLKKNWKGIYE